MIIDTPPLGEISDALRLIDLVDEVVIVVRPGNSDRVGLSTTAEPACQDRDRAGGLPRRRRYTRVRPAATTRTATTGVASCSSKSPCRSGPRAPRTDVTTRALRQPSVTFRPATVLTVLASACWPSAPPSRRSGSRTRPTLLLGMLFVIPAVLNLPAAVIIWVPFAFLPPLGFVGAAPTAGAAVILLAWLPSLRARGAATRALLTLHRRRSSLRWRCSSG